MDEECNMKPSQAVALKEVDSVEIISLADNSIDFLSAVERKEVHQVREWVKERKGEKWLKKHFVHPWLSMASQYLFASFMTTSFTEHYLTIDLVLFFGKEAVQILLCFRSCLARAISQ